MTKSGLHLRYLPKVLSVLLAFAMVVTAIPTSDLGTVFTASAWTAWALNDVILSTNTMSLYTGSSNTLTATPAVH